jgi:hypothetical protein
VKCQRLVATRSCHPPSVKLALIFMKFSLSLQDLLQDLGRYKTYFDIFLMMIFMQIIMPALQMVGGRTVLLPNAGISQDHTISIVKKV